MDFYTSDTHFNHVNILKFCNRPFESLEHMNEELIRRWNETVSPQDRVFHLGDFAMGGGWYEKAPAIGRRLNGEKILVIGNHDRSYDKMRGCGFREVHSSLGQDTEFGRIFLTHAPGPDHEPGDVPEGFSYVLHGHVHEKWDRLGNLINVGVDVRDFRPQTLAQLLG